MNGRFPSLRLALRFSVGVVAAAVFLLVLGRCDWDPTPVEEHTLVVEAFLETSESLPPVLLQQTSPLTAPDSMDNPATGAEVLLTLDGQKVPYESTPAQPGRYVPVQGSTTVPSGVSWRLSVDWNQEKARVGGETPPPLDIRHVCIDVPETPSRAVQVDSLRRDSLDIPADQGYLYPVDVTLRWNPMDQASDTTSWMRAQLQPDASPFASSVVEFFLEPAELRREDRFEHQNGAHQWKGVYAVPVESETAPLPTHTLEAALVRGDTAFASFAQSRTDPERREPISNIEGALGVALAVAVDSVSRVVTDSLSEVSGCP